MEHYPFVIIEFALFGSKQYSNTHTRFQICKQSEFIHNCSCDGLKSIIFYPLTLHSHVFPQGHHSHILIMGGGGGEGVSKCFFGSEILTKSDFLGSIKDTRIFLGHEKKQRDFFGLRKRD